MRVAARALEALAARFAATSTRHIWVLVTIAIYIVPHFRVACLSEVAGMRGSGRGGEDASRSSERGRDSALLYCLAG